MKLDSFEPPGFKGDLLGWGRAVFKLDDATDEGGGESGTNPPAPSVMV